MSQPNANLVRSPRPFVFVVMPFDPAFQDAYELGIRPACEAAGAYCERVDEQIYQENILQRIYNQIAKADLIVADMTARNPNVFYEVGYAHALAKPVVLLTRRAEDIPFDLKHFPHLVYGESIRKLRDELQARVAWHVANPERAHHPGSDAIELFFGGRPIGAGITFQVEVHPSATAAGVTADLALHNASSQVLRNPIEELGLAVPPTISVKSAPTDDDEAPPIILPNGWRLYTFGPMKSLLPDAWESVQVRLVVERSSATKASVEFFVRLFTEFGPRDGRVTLEFVETTKSEPRAAQPYTGFVRTWQST